MMLAASAITDPDFNKFSPAVQARILADVQSSQEEANMRPAPNRWANATRGVTYSPNDPTIADLISPNYSARTPAPPALPIYPTPFPSQQGPPAPAPQQGPPAPAPQQGPPVPPPGQWSDLTLDTGPAFGPPFTMPDSGNDASGSWDEPQGSTSPLVSDRALGLARFGQSMVPVPPIPAQEPAQAPINYGAIGLEGLKDSFEQSPTIQRGLTSAQSLAPGRSIAEQLHTGQIGKQFAKPWYGEQFGPPEPPPEQPSYGDDLQDLAAGNFNNLGAGVAYTGGSLLGQTAQPENVLMFPAAGQGRLAGLALGAATGAAQSTISGDPSSAPANIAMGALMGGLMGGHKVEAPTDTGTYIDNTHTATTGYVHGIRMADPQGIDLAGLYGKPIEAQPPPGQTIDGYPLTEAPAPDPAGGSSLAPAPWQHTKADFIANRNKPNPGAERPTVESVTRGIPQQEGPPGISVESTSNPGTTVIVARDENGQPIGALRHYRDDSGEPDILNVAVDPEYQRQGIATQLYKAADEAGLDPEAASGTDGQTEAGAAFQHARSVRQAVVQGLDVPDHVLADYPDLAPPVAEDTVHPSEGPGALLPEPSQQSASDAPGSGSVGSASSASDYADRLQKDGQAQSDMATNSQTPLAWITRKAHFIIGQGKILAAHIIRTGTEGVIKFVDWAKGMVDQHGPTVQAHLRNIWDQGTQLARQAHAFLADDRGRLIGRRRGSFMHPHKFFDKLFPMADGRTEGGGGSAWGGNSSKWSPTENKQRGIDAAFAIIRGHVGYIEGAMHRTGLGDIDFKRGGFSGEGDSAKGAGFAKIDAKHMQDPESVARVVHGIVNAIAHGEATRVPGYDHRWLVQHDGFTVVLDELPSKERRRGALVVTGYDDGDGYHGADDRDDGPESSGGLPRDTGGGPRNPAGGTDTATREKSADGEPDGFRNRASDPRVVPAEDVGSRNSSSGLRTSDLRGVSSRRGSVAEPNVSQTDSVSNPPTDDPAGARRGSFGTGPEPGNVDVVHPSEGRGALLSDSQAPKSDNEGATSLRNRIADALKNFADEGDKRASGRLYSYPMFDIERMVYLGARVAEHILRGDTILTFTKWADDMKTELAKEGKHDVTRLKEVWARVQEQISDIHKNVAAYKEISVYPGKDPQDSGPANFDAKRGGLMKPRTPERTPQEKAEAKEARAEAARQQYSNYCDALYTVKKENPNFSNEESRARIKDRFVGMQGSTVNAAGAEVNRRLRDEASTHIWSQGGSEQDKIMPPAFSSASLPEYGASSDHTVADIIRTGHQAIAELRQGAKSTNLPLAHRGSGPDGYIWAERGGARAFGKAGSGLTKVAQDLGWGVVYKLPAILALGEERIDPLSYNGSRRLISYDGYTAVVQKFLDGNRHNWVVDTILDDSTGTNTAHYDHV